jgi:hypothetical protein
MFRGPGFVLGRPGFGSALEHQGGQDLEVGVERLTVQGVGQDGRQARLGLLVGKARVGGPKLEIGDQTIKLPVARFDDDKCPFLYFLRGDGQPGAERLFQSAADDVANWVVFAHSLLLAIFMSLRAKPL